MSHLNERFLWVLFFLKEMDSWDVRGMFDGATLRENWTRCLASPVCHRSFCTQIGKPAVTCRGAIHGGSRGAQLLHSLDGTKHYSFVTAEFGVAFFARVRPWREFSCSKGRRVLSSLT